MHQNFCLCQQHFSRICLWNIDSWCIIIGAILQDKILRCYSVWVIFSPSFVFFCSNLCGVACLDTQRQFAPCVFLFVCVSSDQIAAALLTKPKFILLRLSGIRKTSLCWHDLEVFVMRGRQGGHVYVANHPTAPSLSSLLSLSLWSVSSRQHFGASDMFEDGVIIIMSEI